MSQNDHIITFSLQDIQSFFKNWFCALIDTLKGHFSGLGCKGSMAYLPITG